MSTEVGHRRVLPDSFTMDELRRLTFQAACAETAGLAAYFAGLVSVNGGWRASTPISQRLNAVRNKLLSSAYPRTLNDPAQYPLGVWNGMNYIPARPNTNEVPICGYDYTNQKRDAACAYDPGSPATNSSTSPPQSSSISPAQSSSISPPQSSTTSTPPTRATKAAYKPLASPNTNIQYTNLTVQTGNLFGPAINKVITDGLEGICPPTADGVFASCNDGEPFSQNVEYLVPGDGNYIILEANSTFTIPLSNYSSTAKRDAMIAVIAAFMENQAKQGSANCQTNTSSWWDDDCTPENGKREEGSGPGSNPGSKCERFDTMTYCQVPASVQLEITEDNLVVDYMVSGTSPIPACE